MLRMTVRLLSVLIVGGALAGCATPTFARTLIPPPTSPATTLTIGLEVGMSAAGAVLRILWSICASKTSSARNSRPRGSGRWPRTRSPILSLCTGSAPRTKCRCTVPSTVTSQRVAVWSRYDPYWNGRWGRTYDEVIVRNYTEGTLIVDLIDANKKQLAWRAYLVQTVDRDPQKTATRAQANAAAAFAQYPPSKAPPKPLLGKAPRERGRLTRIIHLGTILFAAVLSAYSITAAAPRSDPTDPLIEALRERVEALSAAD